MTNTIPVRHPKPVVPRTLVALVGFCVGFIMLYAAFSTVLHNRAMYSHITDPARQDQNAAILRYVSGPAFAPNPLDFLSADERSHMTDVKRIVDDAYLVYLCCVGVFLGVIAVFVWNRLWPRLDEMLGRALRVSGWTLLAVSAVTALAALLNFDRLWLLLHAILFSQGNWQFPYDSTLITLYPGAFFERFVMRFVLLVSMFGVAAVVLSHVLEHMRRAEAEFATRLAAREQKVEKGQRKKKR